MEKCDIKGCKKNADVFTKTLKFCTHHAVEIGIEGAARLGV